MTVRMVIGGRQYLAEIAAARESGIRAALNAVKSMTHGDDCCSQGCNGMHAENFEWQQQIRPLLGLTPDDELPPEPKCDESCNCIVASFAEPIEALLESEGL